MIALALLPQLYFWRLLAANPADQMTIAEGDFTQEYFPVLLTAAHSLANGALPLWNPLSNGGQPLLADPQAALLYPLTWWVLPQIRGFDGGSLQALERLVPLHFALAGVFTYIMARVLVGSRLGAAVTALTFAYSGYLTSFPVQQLPILRTVTWFPLQVLFLWLAMKRVNLRWSMAGGAAFGLAILAGHPQTAFLEGVGLALLALTWSFQAVAARKGLPWRGLAAFAITMCVGFGLSAAQWAPTYEFMRVSTRQDVGYDFLSAGFGLWEVPLDLLAPRVLGGLPPYVGLLPLLLAAIGLWVRRHPLAASGVVLAASGLLLSLGGHTFLYPLLYKLAPGFDLFRRQERAIFLFALGVALLAGVGAAQVCGVLSGVERRRLMQVIRLAGVILAGLGVLSAAVYVWQLSAEVSGQGVQRWRDMVHWLFFAVLILATSICLLLARTRSRPLHLLLPSLLLGLIWIDLFTVSWDVNLEKRAPDDVYRASEIVKRLLSDTGPPRVDDRGVLNGSHGLVYGVPTVTRNFVLHLARLEQAEAKLPLQRWYDLLDVGFVVTREPRDELGDIVVREQFRDVTNLLYFRAAPGPAYVAPEAVIADSPDDALELVAEQAFDPRRTAVLENPGGQHPLRGGNGTVTSYSRGWDRVVASALAPSGGYLVMSDIAYPGWRATVDGAQAEILRANFLLRAVWLPPGQHDVVVTFEPSSMRLGAAISLATIVLVIVALLGTSLRARTRRISTGDAAQ